MSANTEQYINFILDLLAPLKNISSGRFFGGTGLKSGSVQFAMLMGNSLFFVVDNNTRKKYEEYGMGCFWYETRTKKVNVKKYHEVPSEIIENETVLLEWALESIKTAQKLKK